jgi:alpha-mannosidase
MQADQGRQEFTYSFFAFEGPLAASGVVRAAYELNCPVTTAAGDGGEGSIFRTSAPGIIIDTVKPAEDGSGDIIVRMYESLRARTRCRLATALPVASASQCNMLEEPQRPLTVSGGAMKLDFRAFEIKTLRLKLR